MWLLDLSTGLWLVIAMPLLILLFSNSKNAWRFGIVMSCFNLLLAVALFIQVLHAPILSSVLRLSFLQATLLVLINFLAWIIYRYAATNFQADADSKRFLRWLTSTLLAVQVLVLADHLLLFWLAWVSVSLSLHQLLMFYPNRPRAILAAHKKFLIARCAEFFLGAAFCLIYSVHHSFSITYILAQYPFANLPWQLDVAAILLALVALLKCAQLPLHGWLIQVVESPTPVSALLHAGVINLGGVLLLVFAPLLSQAVIAQWLILSVAGVSAVLAALIMTTRISIKVRLAWSTCAQMGLMLVECALGLYELALLHLIAHSCYKAQAFLSSGSAVRQYLHAEMFNAIQQNKTPNLKNWLSALILVIALITAIFALLKIPSAAQIDLSHITLFPLAPWLVVSFALLSFAAYQLNLNHQTRTDQLVNISFVILVMMVLLAVYVTLKAGIANALNLPATQPSMLADVWVCSLIFLLAISNYFLQIHAPHLLVQRAWIALNAGLYLDEWMTRFTLRWSPVKLNSVSTSKLLSNNLSKKLPKSLTKPHSKPFPEHEVKS